MSYEVKFEKPSTAMRHAMFYNARAVRLILAEARRNAMEGKLWSLDTFGFCFAFAGIQGYPVKCFWQCMKAKNLAR